MQVLDRAPQGMPCLVLNADYQPLSYWPLSTWPWQEAIKNVFLERVAVVSHYEEVVHSPSFEMHVPSVVALREYVTQNRMRAVQSQEGRTHAARGRHAADPAAATSHHARAAIPGPPFPAEIPA